MFGNFHNKTLGKNWGQEIYFNCGKLINIMKKANTGAKSLLILLYPRQFLVQSWPPLRTFSKICIYSQGVLFRFREVVCFVFLFSLKNDCDTS